MKLMFSLKRLSWIKRHPKLIGLGFIVLLLGLAGNATVQKLNSAAVGTVTQQPTIQATANQANQKPITYHGQYISFTVPKDLTIIASQKSGSYLEVVKLYSNDHTSRLVAIGIVRESLANDPGLNNRRGHPEIYKQLSDGSGNLVFTKDQSGSEYTGYLSHADLVATISLSSPYTYDLSVDYKAIAKSWQWK
jgi:hypothetical protein